MATTTPNRLSVGVATPQVRTQDFVIQPLQIAQGALMGSAVANTTLDDLILRPKERANAAQAAQEQMRSRPAITDAVIKAAGAQGQEADRQKEQSRRGLELLKDPEYLVKEAEGQLAAYQSDVLRAKEEYQKALADPELTDEERDKAKKKATDAEAKATSETVKWSRTLLERQAERTASVNRAQTGAVTSGTELFSAQRADQRQPVIEQRADTDAQTANIAAQSAQDRTAVDRAVAAAELRQAIPTASAMEDAIVARNQNLANEAAIQIRPDVAQARYEAGVAQALYGAQAAENMALAEAKRSVIAAASAGMPQLDETSAKALEKAGLTSVNPATGRRWTPVEATNLVNGMPAVQKLREQADTAAGTIQAAQGVLDLINSGVDTGALYGIPGVRVVDGVIAQFGGADAQKREQLRSHSIAFMAQIRKNFPGQVSNFEMSLYESASPSIKNSTETNKALAYAALVTSQRLKEMPSFIQTRLGSMSYDQAEDEWNNYVAANPAIIKNDDGSLKANPYRLSPDEWTAAKANPEQAIRAKALEFAKDPQWTASLPIARVVNNKTQGFDSLPFVLVVNPETGKRELVDNDAYWDKVLQ
jgi:hypothetical protein